MRRTGDPNYYHKVVDCQWACPAHTNVPDYIRLNGKPVAMCRLKPVAPDHRGEIAHLLPKAPAKKNGERVACIGSGPASLGVANDLASLGYEVVIFEKFDKPGGLMRPCLTIAPDGEEEGLRGRLSAPLPQTGRLMMKDEDLCVHCGVRAERCPTEAWDMQKFELLIPYAGRPVCTNSLVPA